jgi:threonine dehydratase
MKREGSSGGRARGETRVSKNSLVSIDAIREAARGLVGVAERTPLVRVSALTDLAGVPVYLKLENAHPTGAFKLRGAWTAIRRLPDERRERGVLTYSSGNHGQAVSFAAKRVGVRAVIVMPETAPQLKVDRVKHWGGEVVFAGTTSEDRYNKGMELAESEGLAVIPPYDHPDIIAGQGTVGLEIAEQLPEVAHVAVPVGGGGLAAGVTTAMAALTPGVRVTGVEPEGADGFNRALAVGHPVRLERSASIADGLLPLSVGTITFKHLKDRADGAIVTDEAIAEATLWLRSTAQVMAEPSGAVTTAALRSGAIEPAGPTVLVVSGGNADPAVIAALSHDLGLS